MYKTVATTIQTVFQHPAEAIPALNLPKDFAAELKAFIFDEYEPSIVPSVGRSGETRLFGNYIVKFSFDKNDMQGELQGNNILRLMSQLSPKSIEFELDQDMAKAILRKEREQVATIKAGENLWKGPSEDLVAREEKMNNLARKLDPLIKDKRKTMNVLVMPYIPAKNLGEYLASLTGTTTDLEYIFQELGRTAVIDIVIGNIDRVVQIKNRKVMPHPNLGNMMVFMHLGERQAAPPVFIDSLLKQSLLVQLAWAKEGEIGLNYESRSAFIHDIEKAIKEGVSAYNDQLSFDQVDTLACVASGVENALKALTLFKKTILNRTFAAPLPGVNLNQYERELTFDCMRVIIESMEKLKTSDTAQDQSLSDQKITSISPLEGLINDGEAVPPDLLPVLRDLSINSLDSINHCRQKLDRLEDNTSCDQSLLIQVKQEATTIKPGESSKEDIDGAIQRIKKYSAAAKASDAAAIT